MPRMSQHWIYGRTEADLASSLPLGAMIALRAVSSCSGMSSRRIVHGITKGRSDRKKSPDYSLEGAEFVIALQTEIGLSLEQIDEILCVPYGRAERFAAWYWRRILRRQSSLNWRRIRIREEIVERIRNDIQSMKEGRSDALLELWKRRYRDDRDDEARR